MFLPNSRPVPPRPHNEPIHSYAPGTPERAALKAAVARLGSEKIELPLVIGGAEVRTGKTFEVKSPHAHARVLATCHEGTTADVDRAIAAARAAWHDWAASSWSSRAAIFLRAAELVSGKYRAILNAAAC